MSNTSRISGDVGQEKQQLASNVLATDAEPSANGRLPHVAKQTHEPNATGNEFPVGSFRGDRGLQRFRVLLTILIAGCLALGVVVWWRLLN